jgi:hypothetical protein
MPKSAKEPDLSLVIDDLQRRLSRIELLLDLEANGGGGMNSKVLGDVVATAIRPLQSRVDALALEVRTGGIGKKAQKKKTVKAK